MKTITRECKTFRTDLLCPVCGEVMERDLTAPVLTTWPEQYTYCCLKCNEVVTQSGVFPKIEYRLVES